MLREASKRRALESFCGLFLARPPYAGRIQYFPRAGLGRPYLAPGARAELPTPYDSLGPNPLAAGQMLAATWPHIGRRGLINRATRTNEVRVGRRISEHTTCTSGRLGRLLLTPRRRSAVYLDSPITASGDEEIASYEQCVNGVRMYGPGIEADERLSVPDPQLARA